MNFEFTDEQIGTIARNMVLFRNHLGWSQRKVAELCELSQKTVNELEHARLHPKLSTILKLADGFDLPYFCFLADDIDINIEEMFAQRLIKINDENIMMIDGKNAQDILTDTISQKIFQYHKKTKDYLFGIKYIMQYDLIGVPPMTYIKEYIRQNPQANDIFLNALTTDNSLEDWKDNTMSDEQYEMAFNNIPPFKLKNTFYFPYLTSVINQFETRPKTSELKEIPLRISLYKNSENGYDTIWKKNLPEYYSWVSNFYKQVVSLIEEK